MSARFTYSRWDGTQTGYSVNADEILDELTDDLLMHGDLQAALRRLMREGMTDKDGNRIEGLREMMDRIRQRKKELEESGDLGGVYSEIADALKDIVDEERHAVENAVRDAEASGDERRAETARDAAMERNFRLDMMPEDLAGLVRELQSYDFESQEAKERFEEMLEKLRQQMMQQVVDQMSEGMQNMSPEDMSRMKDMMAALNQMIEKREQGEDPEFEKFMEEFGDFFPENPQTLDELLENMAQRMQAMQDFMNSLTPEQRSQMQQLSDQLMEDMDLSWQMQQLGEKLSQMFPQPGNGQGYNFRGEQPMDMQQAMQAMAEMGQLNDMEAMMRQAASPAQLSEVDIDKVRDLLGDSAAKSLQKLAEMTKVLEEAGLINNKEGRLEVTPRGLRAIGNNALREMFNKLSKDKLGQHRIPREGSGHERTYDSKPYEFGDPFRLDLQKTIRNAISRQGSGTPVRLSPEDFEIERTEHTTQASTVLLLDLSFSMVQADRFVPAKKVAIAMHSLISSQFPRDFLSIIGFSSIAYPIRPDQLPEVSWDREYGTNMHHAFALARKQLAGKAGTKQIIMITDGEPTSHITPEGYPVFTYPYIQESVELAMREVMRLTKEGITLNSFVLDANGSLRQIIEQMAEINKGRAFFTSADTLGDYVLVDFLENRRRTARSR
jgi:uncharacterized protein with von Willebrand factor type A (vWA) domain